MTQALLFLSEYHEKNEDAIVVNIYGNHLINAVAW